MDDFPIFNTPRTWKYALPWAIVVLLIPVTGKMYISPNPEIQFWAIVPFGMMVLFSIVGLVSLWRYVSTHLAEVYTMRQEALSLTPIVLLAQHMKQMHPEAVRVLNRFGARTSWQVRLNANMGMRDWVLADTNVHLGFIEFVLSNSSTALYPKNRFSQGSKKWDPDGLVEDREQYEEFESWMFSRLMVTRSHGDFKPAEFIPPWTPALIMEVMGMTGEQDLYRPDEEPRKDLGATTPAALVNGNGANGHKQNADDEAELSEGDMAAITQENMRYVEVLKGDSR